MKVYIGVGSNIYPEENITNALLQLRKYVTITGISTFYRTKPLMGKNQANYLNGVWQIEASMSAHDLTFTILKQIENKLHRIKTTDKYRSRTIDLDLLLYGDCVINEGEMKIPDKDIYVRPFITFPLSELDANLILPDTDTPVTTLLNLLSKEEMWPDIQFTKYLRSKLEIC